MAIVVSRAVGASYLSSPSLQEGSHGGGGGAVGGGGALDRAVRLRLRLTIAKAATATTMMAIAPIRAYPPVAGRPGMGVPPGPPAAACGFLVIEIVPEP